MAASKRAKQNSKVKSATKRKSERLRQAHRIKEAPKRARRAGLVVPRQKGEKVKKHARMAPPTTSAQRLRASGVFIPPQADEAEVCGPKGKNGVAERARRAGLWLPSQVGDVSTDTSPSRVRAERFAQEIVIPSTGAVFNSQPALPPTDAYFIQLEEAAGYDEERLRDELARLGWSHQTLAKAFEESKGYAHVRQRMLGLPTVVYLGEKETEAGSEEEFVAEEFLYPFCIAAALIGVSGVAGGGYGIMAMGQRWHGLAHEWIKRSQYRDSRIFSKVVVAGVLLAVQEEPPNPYTTRGYQVRPTRNLWIRKGRLWTLGVPLLSAFMKGGDATLDEVTYIFTMGKDGMRRQLDTPFPFHVPSTVFVDPKRPRNAPPGFYEEFFRFYRRQLVPRSGFRSERKRVQFQEYLAGLVQVPDGLKAAKVAIERLDQAGTPVYGASLVAAWEAKNGMSFWEAVRDVMERFESERRKLRGNQRRYK